MNRVGEIHKICVDFEPEDLHNSTIYSCLATRLSKTRAPTRVCVTTPWKKCLVASCYTLYGIKAVQFDMSIVLQERYVVIN